MPPHRPRPMRDCLIKSCTFTSRQEEGVNLTYHSIPMNLRMYYLHLSGRFLETSLQSFIDKEYLTYKICSRHFTPCQFTWYVKVGNSGFVKCLKSGALPSLHLNVWCSDLKKPQLVVHKEPTKESATQTATEALTTQKATKESATQTEGNWVVSSFLHLTCHDIIYSMCSFFTNTFQKQGRATIKSRQVVCNMP